ncbi:hypothetical protein KJ359_005867 [Pestalotiopsis sp. 9143b]|nr:hypothetical protein KJ359_005867 [Pestalotiopsis sp. 9143b]
MARDRRQTKKKRVLKHSQVGNKKRQLPELKQIFNLQGLVWERGPLVKPRQTEDKIRDALCADLVKFKHTTVVTRIDELFKKLYDYRVALREVVKSSDANDDEDEDDDEDEEEEEEVQYTDWDGMNNMTFQAVGWTRRQKELMPEEINGFTYALISARARAINNPSLEMALNHKKPAFPFADHMDKLLAFMKDKQSPLLPAGEALDMGNYREPADHGMLDEPEEEDEERE